MGEKLLRYHFPGVFSRSCGRCWGWGKAKPVALRLKATQSQLPLKVLISCFPKCPHTVTLRITVFDSPAHHDPLHDLPSHLAFSTIAPTSLLALQQSRLPRALSPTTRPEIQISYRPHAAPTGLRLGLTCFRSCSPTRRLRHATYRLRNQLA